ncbi:6-phosphogluconolactonase [Roseiterribacter gracilis]|uniref:6-phosphogluconolactonase n=1 Tax=Roseiterribacter gracilis TaxID=2812848 RepID=A0A8S8XFH7_9PROT|nr:6-phosphogluconolactonase [Rhodospirillales bacterium TMPK1]
MILERDFADAHAAADWLAVSVATRLEKALRARDRAGLVVSGGRTPALFFDRLAQQAIEWKLVTVTLADERCVPADHADSNQRFVRERLLVGPAAVAMFVPLSDKIAALPHPWDVTVLGMGEDGHTASLFPDGDTLAQALSPATTVPVVALTAPGAKQRRLTMTLPELTNTHALFVQISGAAKKRVLEDARRADTPPPIGLVLRAAPADSCVVWSPDGGQT